jgi:hypothetical protein
MRPRLTNASIHAGVGKKRGLCEAVIKIRCS